MKGLVSARGAVKDMPDKPPAQPPRNPPEGIAQRLPEEFAPTGPKLSRFPIQPAPPVRPRLFADESRFALRLAVLAGATELAAWAWILRSHGGLALAAGALRCARPLWAWLGTRAPRPAVAFGLLAVALLAQGACIITIGGFAPAAALFAALPALGDLASSCIADSITVERRAAAYARLDMGQALGCALGVSLAASAPAFVPLGAAASLLVAGLCVQDLHDRGTPRSSWPLATYLDTLTSPLVAQLAVLALLTGACAAAAARASAAPFLFPAGWPRVAVLAAALAPLAGMFLVARTEPAMRNAVLLPRAIALLAGGALGVALLSPAAALLAGLLLLGAAATALPASVARGAGEMERPLAASLAFTALFVGAALGRALLR
jgi:hypothetical protein